jgi:hypothetical protein
LPWPATTRLGGTIWAPERREPAASQVKPRHYGANMAEGISIDASGLANLAGLTLVIVLSERTNVEA